MKPSRRAKPNPRAKPTNQEATPTRPNPHTRSGPTPEAKPPPQTEPTLDNGRDNGMVVTASKVAFRPSTTCVRKGQGEAKVLSGRKSSTALGRTAGGAKRRPEEQPLSRAPTVETTREGGGGPGTRPPAGKGRQARRRGRAHWSRWDSERNRSAPGTRQPYRRATSQRRDRHPFCREKRAAYPSVTFANMRFPLCVTEPAVDAPRRAAVARFRPPAGTVRLRRIWLADGSTC
jgi:hypothetical protein